MITRIFITIFVFMLMYSPAEAEENIATERIMPASAFEITGPKKDLIIEKSKDGQTVTVRFGKKLKFADKHPRWHIVFHSIGVALDIAGTAAAFVGSIKGH